MSSVFNLLLLTVCSIFLARVMEKRMKVASVAHAILFIVMSFYYLLTSNFELIQFAMRNIFGETYYGILHNALLETAGYYQVTMFALFFVETITICFTAFLSFMLILKQMKYLMNKIQSRPILHTNSHLIPDYAYNPGMGINNKQDSYLVLAHLRN